MDKEDNRKGEEISQQQRWDDIRETDREAAEKVLGFINIKNRSQHPTITHLPVEQKNLGKCQNTENDPTKRDQIRRERNSKLTELHKRVKEKEHEKIISQLKKFKNNKSAGIDQLKSEKMKKGPSTM